jgi:prepilin-type N-terminal cleavage/methylation domain-containing protein
MRSGSTGTRAASQSKHASVTARRAGFTLLEALVALALVLAFAAALAPHLFHARRIVGGAEGRLAAQVLLRTLLDAPFDRAALVNATREGSAGGLRWRLTTLPLAGGAPTDHPAWMPVRLVASVTWAPGQMISAETVRLARPETK